MISAVGGTLGLFTGISIITFVEIVYWSFKLSAILLGKMKDNVLSYGKSMYDEQEKEKNAKSSDEVFAFQITNGLKVPPSNIWKRIHIIWRKNCCYQDQNCRNEKFIIKYLSYLTFSKIALSLSHFLSTTYSMIPRHISTLNTRTSITLHFTSKKLKSTELFTEKLKSLIGSNLISKIQSEKTQKLSQLFPDFRIFLKLNFE